MKKLIALFAIVVLLVNGALAVEGSAKTVSAVSNIDRTVLDLDRFKQILENGVDIEISGVLEVVYYESYDSFGEGIAYFVSYEGKKYRIFFGEEVFYPSGASLRIKGKYLMSENVESDSDLKSDFDLATLSVEEFSSYSRGGVASDIEIVDSNLELGDFNLGEYRVALVLINTGGSLSASEAEQTFQSKVASKIASWSYGKTYLRTDVYGPINIPGYNFCTESNDYYSLLAQSLDFSLYKGVVVIFPKSGCSSRAAFSNIGPGVKTINGQDFYFSDSKINGIDALTVYDSVLHEFGHMLGLGHQTDTFDIMASGYTRGSGRFNAAGTDHIGWLEEGVNVIRIDDVAQSGGRYDLESLDVQGNGLKALKIRVVDYEDREDAYYYFSYRSGCQSANCGVLNVHDAVNPSLALALGYYQQGQTFFLDPSESFHSATDLGDIIVSVIETSGNKMSIFVGKYYCGNGVIDLGEECDSENVRGFNCEDVGFESGNLGCNSECEFDTLECKNRICAQGDVAVSGRTCYSEIKAEESDGRFIVQRSFSSDSERDSVWGEMLSETTADVFLSNSIYNLIFLEYNFVSLLERTHSISRLIFPFDTSKIPDSSRMLDARIKIAISRSGVFLKNSHPSSKDFLSLVPYNIHGDRIDKDDFGSFDKEKLASDVDLSSDYISNGNDLTFDLNGAGRAHLNKMGKSFYGIITGYDFDGGGVNSGEKTDLSLYLISSDPSAQHNTPPLLLLMYYVPEFSFIENNDDREVSGNLNLKIEKLVGESYLIYSSVYSGNVNVAPKSKLRLADYWGGASLSESGKYRAIVEFKVGEKTYRDEKEFYVRPESCGNGAVDSGEQCDSANLASFGNGIGQCKYYDSDFVYGDLRCNDACQFDLSSCFVSSGRACASGDRNNGDGTCTAVLTSLSRDGTFSSSNSEGFSWKDFVRRNVADSFDSSGLNFEIANRYLLGGMSTGMYIKRPLISFDTSKIPDEASIIGATLYLRTFVQSAPHISDSNYQNDFVTLVDIGVSGDGVQLSDYGNVGEELVSRDKAFRVRGAVMNKEYSFPILPDKLAVVDKTGVSDFALRAGLELDNNILSNRPNTLISTRFYSSESSYKPRLEVTYFP